MQQARRGLNEQQQDPLTQQSAGAEAEQPHHEQQQHPLSNDLYLRQQRQQLTGAGAEQQHHEQQQQLRTQNPQQPHAHDASSNADKKLKAVEDT